MVDRAKQSWASGLAVFAGVMMMMIGGFQVLWGFAAIVKKEFFVVTPNYLYSVSVTTWGWIHLIIGIGLIVAGIFLLLGQTWARWVGMLVAGISALAQFMSLPHYPVWGILIIALDVAVIWGLAVWEPEHLA